MFYSNNDSYMQDLYYYNQIPNSTFMNGCGNSMLGNSNMQPMMQGGIASSPNNQIFMNSGMIPNNMPIQNLSNMYPSIYRILNPVISRIVSNNNQSISEDLLNNMTDTVFNIVEGQIDLGEDYETQGNNRTDNQSINANSSNNNSSNRGAETTRQNSQNPQTSNTRHNRNDSLLRDLIKILIIKELLSRNHFQRQYRK